MQQAAQTKLDMCRRMKERSDMATCIIGWREHVHPVSYVMCSPDKPEDLGLIFSSVAVGMNARYMVLLQEAYTAMNGGPLSQAINPFTNEPWKQGELSDVAQRSKAIELGWLTEMLVSVGFDRYGNIAVLRLPYTWEQDFTPEFGEGEMSFYDQDASGAVPQHTSALMANLASIMRQVQTHRSATDTASRRFLEHAEHEQDVITLQHVLDHGHWGYLISEEGSPLIQAADSLDAMVIRNPREHTQDMPLVEKISRTAPKPADPHAN